MSRDLAQLARLYGVQTAYRNVSGATHHASEEALVAVLRGLGAPIESPRDVPDALRERRGQLALRPLEPVIVAWDGGPATTTLRLPANATGTITCELRMEDGGACGWSVPVKDLAKTSEVQVDGRRTASYALPIPGDLPSGYHHLDVQTNGDRAQATVISAPRKAYLPPDFDRRWGVFLPLYALRNKRNWGAGDFTDLGDLAEWVGALGGSAVGTLPLLAAFLDEPFRPSPYSPAGRLAWNEFYIDIEAMPEFALSKETQRIAASPDFQRELQELRAAPVVDYKWGMALKRRVLEAIQQDLFSDKPGRYRQYVWFAEDSDVNNYAIFRAITDRQRKGSPDWPERLRNGDIQPADYDDADYMYHLYAQSVAADQVRRLAERSQLAGVALYFDYPLGVDGDSYDVWRYRQNFATGLSGGAPPDSFFTLGQDWGFPPQHPEGMRRDGYRYLTRALRHLMAPAGVLRIDHIMGLHRLYCIPQGMSARDGAYVRYPADELYAVLSLESHRNQTALVGEDLGTVPPYVRTAMARHQVHRTYVFQYEASADAQPPAPAPKRLSVASLNTHDMPPFAAYWQALDIEDRKDLGLMDEAQATAERRRAEQLRRAVTQQLREGGWLNGPGGQASQPTPSGGQARQPDNGVAGGAETPAEALRASLRMLAAGPEHLLLVNLEDLWLETAPQNVPGTVEERPNWQRKAKLSLEEMREDPRVTAPLREIDRLRKERRRR